MKFNAFWFVGSTKVSDSNKKQLIIDIILDELKRMNISTWNVKNILENTDLSHSEREGFYLLDANNGLCTFVDTSNVSNLVISLIKENAFEIMTDIDSKEEINKKIDEVKHEIEELVMMKQDLENQKNEIDNQIAKKKQEITILTMKIRKIDNPEPKVKVDDYILYKSYGSTPVVWKITEVKVDSYRYCWVYRGKRITTGEYDYINPNNIISVIATKPSYKELDVVEIDGKKWTIRLVRYDNDKECWKYKIDMIKNGMKSSTWIYESDIK